jgi:hypothetical protein
VAGAAALKIMLVVAAFLILVQWLYDNMHVSELVSDSKHETVLWDEKVLKAKVSCLINEMLLISISRDEIDIKDVIS